MPTIIYCVETGNVQEIKRYVTNNTNLPELNSIPCEEEKPVTRVIEPHYFIVINSSEEDEQVRQNTISQAIKKFDSIIIPVKSIAIQEIQELLSEDVSVHLPRVGIKITRHRNITNEILDALTPLSDDDVIRRHTGGRSPLGTDIEDGFLVKSDDYQHVRETLTKHREDDISKEEAADHLNTTPRTVERAAQRKQLYQLQ